MWQFNTGNQKRYTLDPAIKSDEVFKLKSTTFDNKVSLFAARPATSNQSFDFKFSQVLQSKSRPNHINSISSRPLLTAVHMTGTSNFQVSSFTPEFTLGDNLEFKNKINSVTVHPIITSGREEHDNVYNQKFSRKYISDAKQSILKFKLSVFKFDLDDRNATFAWQLSNEQKKIEHDLMYKLYPHISEVPMQAVQFAKGFSYGMVTSALTISASELKYVAPLIRFTGYAGTAIVTAEFFKIAHDFERDNFIYTEDFENIAGNPLISSSRKSALYTESVSIQNLQRMEAGISKNFMQRLKEHPEALGFTVGGFAPLLFNAAANLGRFRLSAYIEPELANTVEKLTKGQIIGYLQNVDKVPTAQLANDLGKIGFKLLERRPDKQIYKFSHVKSELREVAEVKANLESSKVMVEIHFDAKSGPHMHITDAKGNVYDKHLNNMTNMIANKFPNKDMDTIIKKSERLPEAHIKIKEFVELNNRLNYE